jgi:hypothetical protein
MLIAGCLYRVLWRKQIREPFRDPVATIVNSATVQIAGKIRWARSGRELAGNQTAKLPAECAAKAPVR